MAPGGRGLQGAANMTSLGSTEPVPPRFGAADVLISVSRDRGPLSGHDLIAAAAASSRHRVTELGMTFCALIRTGRYRATPAEPSDKAGDVLWTLVESGD